MAELWSQWKDGDVRTQKIKTMAANGRWSKCTDGKSIGRKLISLFNETVMCVLYCYNLIGKASEVTPSEKKENQSKYPCSYLLICDQEDRKLWC